MRVLQKFFKVRVFEIFIISIWTLYRTSTRRNELEHWSVIALSASGWLDTATGGDQEVRDGDDLQVGEGIITDVVGEVGPGVHQELDGSEMRGGTARTVYQWVVLFPQVLGENLNQYVFY